MPLAEPAQVVLRFKTRTQNLLRDFDELMLAVHQKRRQASLETMLAEQSVMYLAVFWEAFINDLITSYIVQYPSPCLTDTEKRFRKSISDKFGGMDRWITVSFPDKISEVHVAKLIDPKGFNVVATSAQALSDVANRWLDAADARKFSLEVDDRDFVDYLVALRNYLGHRSDGSRSILRQAMREIKTGGANSELQGDVRSVGTYLKQRVTIGTRVKLVGDRAIEVASKLA
jgi:hypothetical protein